MPLSSLLRFMKKQSGRMVAMRNRLTLRSAVAIAAAVMLGDGAGAQTLVDPSSQPAPSRPPLAAKPPASRKVKSCSEYGAGFVNIPGTGACIKTGGFVTVESTNSRGR
jgi:hypothetical protein